MAANQGAIAAGFLHALRTPSVYAEWQTLNTTDPQAVGAFIQKTLGLAQAPSASELAEMATYANEHLSAEHEQLRAIQKDAPHSCGVMYSSQQQ